MKDIEAIDQKRHTVHFFDSSNIKKTRVHRDRGANAALDRKGMMDVIWFLKCFLSSKFVLFNNKFLTTHPHELMKYLITL
jgi:hypothetical protein